MPHSYDAFISYSHALDGTLAPAVQRGLARFAKSWWQVRALRVFRDQTNLAVTPKLWPEIEHALDESRYLVLFAAPESADSQWVRKEFDYWCDHKSSDSVLLALTGGELAWDNDRNDFDWATTTALHPSARGRFTDEPRWVDLRWARTRADVTLQDPRFQEVIADLAATVHGRPKDELIGEDVRQHRRTRRLARGVTVAITAFAVAVTVLAVVAVRARNRAESESALATSRFLSAAAVESLDQHMDRAALLGVQALHTRDTAESRDALFTTVQHAPDAQRYLRASGPEADGVAISPDGRVAAAIDHDGMVAIWAVSTGRPLVEPVAAHEGGGYTLAFSPDSKLLATGGADGVVAVWNGRTLAPVRRMKVKDPEVHSLAWASDNARLVAGGGKVLTGVLEEKPVKVELFDVTSGADLGGVGGLTNSVPALAFSADGKRLWYADQDAASDLGWWDVESGQGHAVPIKEIVHAGDGFAVSPDRKHLAVTSADYADGLVWDVVANKAAGRLAGLEGSFSGLAYSPEGDRIAAGTYDGEVGVWNARDLAEPVRRLAGHDRTMEGGGTVVAFGPHGLLISGASGGEVVLHNLRSTTRLVSDVLSGNPDEDGRGEAVVNERGDFALGRNDSSKVRLFDARGGAKRSITLPDDTHPSDVSALSPDGTRMTAVMAPTQDAIDAEQTDLAMVDTIGSKVIWTASGRPVGMEFSPDGSTVAIAGEDGAVALLDAATGARIATLPDQPVPAAQRRYDDLALRVGEDRVPMAFSPDGRTLAVGNYDGPVWLWDVREAELASPTPLLGHGRVSSLVFSPDGQTLATGGHDEQIRLWRVADASLTGLMADRPQGRVYRLLFHPDGRTLVSSSPEVELWDVGERRRLGRPVEEISDALSKMAFIGGSQLMIANPAGYVRRIDLSVDSWTARVCAIANRDLSASEVRQFLGGRPAHPCAP